MGYLHATGVRSKPGGGGGLTYAIPFIEIVLPLLLVSKRHRLQTMGALSVSVLYAAFSYFQFDNIRSGQLKPCSCLGPVLSLSPFVMLFVSGSLCIIAFLLIPRIYAELSASYANAKSWGKGIFHLMVALMFGTFGFRLATEYELASPNLIEYEPMLSLDRDLLLQISSLRTPVHSKKKLIALVDPKCPYSRKLLTRLNKSTEQLELRIVYYPVLSEPSERANSLATISTILKERRASISPRSFDYYRIEGARAFCDRYANRRVPVLWGFDGENLVRLATGTNVGEAIKQFSKLELGRSKT